MHVSIHKLYIYLYVIKKGNDVDSVDVVVHALTSRLGALSRSTL